MNHPKTVKFQARNGKTAECGACRKPIVKGDRYRFVYQGFRGAKLVRCTSAACDFKRSEYTSSKMAGVYAASENAHEALDALMKGDSAFNMATDLASVDSDIEQILSEAAENWRDVANEYEEAADNMGDGFGDATRERAEQINDAADELENAAPSVDEPGACEEHETITEDCSDCGDAVREAIQNVIDEAHNAIDESEASAG